MRTGLIGQKIGMTRVFTPDGEHVPLTLLYVEKCQVVAQKTLAKDGYSALQLGVGTPKIKNLSKALRGHFSAARVEPKKKMQEFLVSEDAFLEVGTILCVSHFVPGQFVDVSGISLGKGFAGPMKRHNFGGLRASHGVSISHRSHGSIGQREDPGRVFKGKKMAGHMGCARVTVQNLRVFDVDVENSLILIRGAVPGYRGGYVRVSDAVKKSLPDGVPFPGSVGKQKEVDNGSEERNVSL